MISFKHMYLRALPLFLTGSAALFTNWTDTYVSSFFGAPAVAAIGICSMLFFVLVSFSNGFSVAIQSFTAGFLTSRKNNEILDAFIVCMVMGVGLAFLLTAASIYFLEDILRFMNRMRRSEPPRGSIWSLFSTQRPSTMSAPTPEAC